MKSRLSLIAISTVIAVLALASFISVMGGTASSVKDDIPTFLGNSALMTIADSTNVNDHGNIIYVDVDNTGFEDGTQAHPFNTIQEAIDYAIDGNTVLVLPGIYVENLTIHGKRINLRSDLGPEKTVIDGGSHGSVIRIIETTSTTDAVIDGFTIQNGGGIQASSADGFGVVMILTGGEGMDISATIQNNIITGNNLRGGIGIRSSNLGEHFEISIINNRIIENLARETGDGGGITLDVPDDSTGFINVKNNIIANNSGYSGGGLRFMSGDSNSIINILNNTVYSNLAYVGGGIVAYASNLNLINNIFFSNQAEEYWDELYVVQASLSANVSFNIIGDGQFAGVNGNFSSDPLLVNPSSGDFHLKVGSPAIDAGTMVPVPKDFDNESRPYDGNRTGGAQWDIGGDEFYPPLWYSFKTVNSSSALPGEILSYTISLINSSLIPIENAYITDTLPTSLTYIDNSLSATSGNFSEEENIITWTGSVSKGVTITYGTIIRNTIPFSSVIINTATISDTSSKFERSVPIRVASDLYLPHISSVFCSPYSDNFSNPASGWPITDDGNVRLEYLDDEYRMLVRPINWGVAAHPGFHASDYSVSVNLRNPNKVMGSYGIGFGIVGDWSTFYTLEIYPDGWYGIYRYDPNDVVTLSEAYSSAIHQGSATNHIEVERNGASINAYANGQLLTSVTDGTYTGDLYLGLALFSYEQPNLDIHFDNFAVYPVSCGGLKSLSNLSGGSLTFLGQQYFNFNSIDIGHSGPER